MAGEADAYAYEYVFDDENSYDTEGEVDNWKLQTQPDCACTEIRKLQVC